GAGDDILAGESDNDRLYGEDGDDTLNGGFGNDRLVGGAGNDRLIGLTGINIVTGNEGNDVFVFTAEQTTITDFEDGFDQIDVSALAGIDSFDDVNVVALGSSVKLVFAEGTITMLDTTAGELDATDFIF
ncbi:MAG: calcium-binding protein, partial [Rhodobacteraceae bacterium]|nr:calcium-binding protein [Paracoccaceae bacterium]